MKCEVFLFPSIDAVFFFCYVFRYRRSFGGTFLYGPSSRTNRCLLFLRRSAGARSTTHRPSSLTRHADPEPITSRSGATEHPIAPSPHKAERHLAPMKQKQEAVCLDLCDLPRGIKNKTEASGKTTNLRRSRTQRPSRFKKPLDLIDNFDLERDLLPHHR